MDTFVIDYDRLGFHRWMLADRARTDAYRRALLATVRPGDVVLDVGAGTAVLGMLAAQAGARKVYAIELTGIAALAQRLARENGLDGRVEVIQGDAEAVALPERVDLIVSEVWGYIGVDENLLATLLVCRDRWLKPGGRMLPHMITSWMAPVHDAWLEHELRFWRSRPYGLDLSAIAELSVDEVRGEQHHITRESLLAERQQLWTTDVRTTSVAEARRAFEAHLRFVASRRGRLSGLAAWFSMEFPDGTTLSNGPDDPPTHWGREVLPLRGNVEVEAGTLIEARLRCGPARVGVRHQQWSARVGEGEWEEHATGRSGAQAQDAGASAAPSSAAPVRSWSAEQNRTEPGSRGRVQR